MHKLLAYWYKEHLYHVRETAEKHLHQFAAIARKNGAGDLMADEAFKTALKMSMRKLDEELRPRPPPKVKPRDEL